MYCALGAAGGVLSENSSKSRASSKKVTMPRSSGQRNALSHRRRSVVKMSSHGQLLRVGVANLSTACFVGGGRGPTNW